MHHLNYRNAPILSDFEITPKLLHKTSTSSPSLSQTCIGCTKHNTSNSVGHYPYKCTCKSSFESEVSDIISLNKVNMLKTNISEDSICRSIPISGKIQPISILKKPKYNVAAKRKHFYLQSRSLDYEDLKCFKTHRKIRYEDEIYGSQKFGKISKLSPKSYSEGNILLKQPSNEIDQSHYLVMEDKVVSIGYDSDVGWLRKSEAHVPKFSKSLDEYIEAKKRGNLNRESLSLELTRTTAEKLHSTEGVHGQKRRKRTLPQPPLSMKNSNNQIEPGFTTFVLSPFVDNIETKTNLVNDDEPNVSNSNVAMNTTELNSEHKCIDNDSSVLLENSKNKVDEKMNTNSKNGNKTNENTEFIINKENIEKTERKASIIKEITTQTTTKKEEIIEKNEPKNVSEDVFDDDDLFDLEGLIANEKSSSNINGSDGKPNESNTNIVSDSSNSNHGVAKTSTSSLKHTNQSQSLNPSSDNDAPNRNVKTTSKDNNNCRISGPNNKSLNRANDTNAQMKYSDFNETSSSRGESFNRSESNADGTHIEDKLGKEINEQLLN